MAGDKDNIIKRLVEKYEGKKEIAHEKQKIDYLLAILDRIIDALEGPCPHCSCELPKAALSAKKALKR